MSRKFYIDTFGCQMNMHDSEKMAGLLSEEGYSPVDNPGEADIIIFNTCSVREKAEQKFFSELGRIKSLKKKRPALKIGVAGCIAQAQGKKILKRAPHVDFVFGPQNIHLLHRLIDANASVIANADNPEIAETDLPVMRGAKGRAWVSVIYGCNNFCSYCIVPYTRGRERSRPSHNILEEIEDLAGKGFKEVTLLGQNVNSYLSDINFPSLLKKINSIRGIERVRFVTSHPRDLSNELISAMCSLDRVCEHIHLPLQSASDRILRLMNRGYLFDEYRRKVDMIRSMVKEISITTDIITGFPGETGADHADTLKALRDIEFDGIFAFKFSPRTGTKAALMENHIAEGVKSERLSEILEVQDKITLKLNKKFENSIQEILVEGFSETDKNFLTGRTRSNKIVNFKGDDSWRGRIIRVKIIEAKRHSLKGELL